MAAPAQTDRSTKRGVHALDPSEGLNPAWLGPERVVRGQSRLWRLTGGTVKGDVRKEAPSRAVLEVELPPEAVSQGMERALAQLNRGGGGRRGPRGGEAAEPPGGGGGDGG